MKKEDNFGNLYKKIDATSKMRFHSSRRLKDHSKLSTATVVFISMVLILTSLMQAYQIGENHSSKYLSLIQVFSSITVLVYSLLIEKNDFSSLSEKMYSCASKLGELKQRIYPHLENGTLNQYQNFEKEYHSILKLYETASINDFRADYLRAKLDMPENYPMKWKERGWIIFKVYFMYLMNFIQYIALLAIFSCLLWWLWFAEKASM